LTLTHNATALILLGGANRITAAGDVGLYASDASGNWRERAYFRAASNPGDAATKSGTETFSNKTFADAVTVSNSGAGRLLNLVGPNPGNIFARLSGGATAVEYVNGASHRAWIMAAQYNVSEAFEITPSTAVGGTTYSTPALIIYASGGVTPGTDNAQNLGSSAARWSVIYAGTGTINTSGAATKIHTRNLSAAEIAVAKALAAQVRVFQFCDAVAKKGEAARWHAGMLYEEVVAAFEAENLDPLQYGIVCRDRCESDPSSWIVGLRSDELAQFVMAGLAARLDALEARHSL
jgi:hypothetical protein